MLRSTWSERKNVEPSGTCMGMFTCFFCCSEEWNTWRKLLVDAVWQWRGWWWVWANCCRCMDNSSNLWSHIYQQNYMGGVSRLLVASPRPRPMEKFFLVFSSLVGIDAPYFCLFLEILLSHFPLLFFKWLSQCHVDTGVFICIDILLLCNCLMVVLS